MITAKIKGQVTVRVALSWANGVLAESGVDSPIRDARRLLAFALGVPYLTIGPRDSLPRGVRRRFVDLVFARARRVPLPLLFGKVGFLDFELYVQPGVFIPRPETEELAARACDLLRAFSKPWALDLGTGTGALAIALARAHPTAKVVAVDVDRRAIACARRNVRALGLQGRVEVRRSDWFSAVTERFHIVVANPPYIPTADIPGLAPEIRRYEPIRALDGGPDGLYHIRRILTEVSCHLFPGGWLVLEIGHGQGEEVVRFAANCPDLVEMAVVNDLSKKERFFIARCR